MSGRGNLRKNESGQPPSVGTPDTVSQTAAQTGQLVRAVQDAMAAGLGPIKENLDRVERSGHTNFRWLLVAFGAGFLVVAGMAIEAYRWGQSDLSIAVDRLERRIDKIGDGLATLDKSQGKTDQKLQDFIDRVSPAPQPMPRRP